MWVNGELPGEPKLLDTWKPGLQVSLWNRTGLWSTGGMTLSDFTGPSREGVEGEVRGPSPTSSRTTQVTPTLRTFRVGWFFSPRDSRALRCHTLSRVLPHDSDLSLSVSRIRDESEEDRPTGVRSETRSQKDRTFYPFC